MPDRAAAEAGLPAAGAPAWRLWGATGLGLVALFVSLAAWEPLERPGPVFCLFRRTTGVACPACGLTRAAALAAHGRFAESFALHPGLPLLALEAVGAWLLWGERLRSGRRRLDRWRTPVLVATVAGLVALWIARLLTGRLPP